MGRPLTTALLAAALLAGCGDGGSPSAAAPSATPAATRAPAGTPGAAPAADPEAAPVQAALRRYAAAVRAGDAAAICRDLLARAILDRVQAAGGSCERELIAPRIEEGGPDYAITVRSVSVEGDRAVAEITAVERDGPRDSRQPLVRERGGWRLGAS